MPSFSLKTIISGLFNHTKTERDRLRRAKPVGSLAPQSLDLTTVNHYWKLMKAYGNQSSKSVFKGKPNKERVLAGLVDGEYFVQIDERLRRYDKSSAIVRFFRRGIQKQRELMCYAAAYQLLFQQKRQYTQLLPAKTFTPFAINILTYHASRLAKSSGVKNSLCEIADLFSRSQSLQVNQKAPELGIMEQQPASKSLPTLNYKIKTYWYGLWKTKYQIFDQAAEVHHQAHLDSLTLCYQELQQNLHNWNHKTLGFTVEHWHAKLEFLKSQLTKVYQAQLSFYKSNQWDDDEEMQGHLNEATRAFTEKYQNLTRQLISSAKEQKTAYYKRAQFFRPFLLLDDLLNNQPTREALDIMAEKIQDFLAKKFANLDNMQQIALGNEIRPWWSSVYRLLQPKMDQHPDFSPWLQVWQSLLPPSALIKKVSDENRAATQQLFENIKQQAEKSAEQLLQQLKENAQQSQDSYQRVRFALSNYFRDQVFGYQGCFWDEKDLETASWLAELQAQLIKAQEEALTRFDSVYLQYQQDSRSAAAIVSDLHPPRRRKRTDKSPEPQISDVSRVSSTHSASSAALALLSEPLPTKKASTEIKLEGILAHSETDTLKQKEFKQMFAGLLGELKTKGDVITEQLKNLSNVEDKTAAWEKLELAKQELATQAKKMALKVHPDRTAAKCGPTLAHAAFIYFADYQNQIVLSWTTIIRGEVSQMRSFDEWMREFSDIIASINKDIQQLSKDIAECREFLKKYKEGLQKLEKEILWLQKEQAERKKEQAEIKKEQAEIKKEFEKAKNEGDELKAQIREIMAQEKQKEKQKITSKTAEKSDEQQSVTKYLENETPKIFNATFLSGAQTRARASLSKLPIDPTLERIWEENSPGVSYTAK
jgi:hypothetical protein